MSNVLTLLVKRVDYDKYNVQTQESQDLLLVLRLSDCHAAPPLLLLLRRRLERERLPVRLLDSSLLFL